MTSLDASVAFNAKSPVYFGQELQTDNNQTLVTFSLRISLGAFSLQRSPPACRLQHHQGLLHFLFFIRTSKFFFWPYSSIVPEKSNYRRRTNPSPPTRYPVFAELGPPFYRLSIRKFKVMFPGLSIQDHFDTEFWPILSGLKPL